MTTTMPIAPPWLDLAGNYLGTREIPGARSNEVILRWALHEGGWIAKYFTDDDIPWCALFVNAVLRESGIKGTGSLAARSFESWGRGLHTPALGAVMVFARNGGGHVGFYLGERSRDGAFRIRGGNQGNAVSDTWIARDRLVTVRWPYAFADGRTISLPPDPRRVALTDDGAPLSTSEA